MQANFFQILRVLAVASAMQSAALTVAAEPMHGIAMYGAPALPPDFVALPYVNPNAPQGGRLIEGATGGFDSLNPFQRKGTAPWQLRFYAYESLMARNLDEPFSLYGLLAESVEVATDRSWVEFTLNPAARFSDGSPVTIADVIWSYEVLGTVGHRRYEGFWTSLASITQTGPLSLRMSFNEANPELVMLAGMRPILKKAQWDGRDFADGSIHDIPIGSAPYVVTGYEQGRNVVLTRNRDYWGADLPVRRGTANLDEIRIEYFGDESVLFEAFKSGLLSVYREPNAEKWAAQYGFPAVRSGAVVLSEVAHARPSGMTGLAINTTRAHLSDWRVREALIHAFNYTYIADTLTGGRAARITSYFSNWHLGMRPGPAAGAERALLAPFAADLPPGTLDGYALPTGDSAPGNRADLRRAVALLAEAGWTVQDGALRDSTGTAFVLQALLRQGDGQTAAILEIYRNGLERLGITLQTRQTDNAGFVEAEARLDFDLIPLRRDLSLSPGTEQRLYWSSQMAGLERTRNIPGVASPAVDAMIEALLAASDPDGLTAAARALDRALVAGRYVIPIWTSDADRIAHSRMLKFPENTPIYGDRPGWMPDVWWFEADN